VDPDLLLRGGLIGLSIAAPVGPIGVLCIRRTLAEGWSFGLVSGLGAATADALYGCVAGFGLTFISAALISHQAGLRMVGGLFLCYQGIRTLLALPAERAAAASGEGGLLRAYGSTFLLTLTNPMTILAFAAIFAGLGLAEAGGGYASAVLLVLGVFLGSASWWLLLSSVVGAFRTRFSLSGLLWVNRVSGLIILGFGAYALVTAARM
jgi:threonine/homoserine/homoserine lactone efflux protein